MKKTNNVLENLANAIYVISASAVIGFGSSIVAWLMITMLIKLLREYLLILAVAFCVFIVAMDAKKRIITWFGERKAKREKEKNTILLDGYDPVNEVYYSVKAWA